MSDEVLQKSMDWGEALILFKIIHFFVFVFTLKGGVLATAGAFVNVSAKIL